MNSEPVLTGADRDRIEHEKALQERFGSKMPVGNPNYLEPGFDPYIPPGSVLKTAKGGKKSKNNVYRW